MYTFALRVERCALLTAAVCALAACGDDSGGNVDSVANTPCTINGAEMETSVEGCPPTASTSCGMAGGSVTRVCYPQGTTPVLPQAPMPGETPTQGVWSPCCCAQSGNLFCGGGAAGQTGMSTCGNGTVEAGETCGEPGLAAPVCPGGGVATCDMTTCTVNTTMCGQTPNTAGNSP